MHRTPSWATIGLLLLAAGLSGCALRHARNRPLLARLDEVLPQPETTAGSVALGVGILPLTIPAGLLDTFVANPALQTGEAASDTRQLLWESEESSLFQEAALFVPKLAATPIVFLGDWLWCSVVGGNDTGGDDPSDGAPNGEGPGEADPSEAGDEGVDR